MELLFLTAYCTYALANSMQSDASSAFLQLSSPPSGFMVTNATSTSNPVGDRTGYAVQKRPAPKRINRPATAPAADDLLLLPSLPSRHTDGSITPFSSPDPEHRSKSPTENGLCSVLKGSEDEPELSPSLGQYIFLSVSLFPSCHFKLTLSLNIRYPILYSPRRHFC